MPLPDPSVPDPSALAHLIGHACPPFTVEVEKGAIRRFAEALGDRNPIRHDEDAARAAGYAGLVASPTFPASFRVPGDPPWMLRLDRSRIRAGEQGFRLHRPILAGDRLVCRLTLTAVEAKEGRSGPLTLLVQDLAGSDEAGVAVFGNRRVAVHLGAL